MWWCFIVVRFDYRFLSWMKLRLRWYRVLVRWLISLTKASFVNIVSLIYTLFALVSMLKSSIIWLSILAIECFAPLYSKRMWCINVQWMDNFQCLSCFVMVEDPNKWNNHYLLLMLSTLSNLLREVGCVVFKHSIFPPLVFGMLNPKSL